MSDWAGFWIGLALVLSTAIVTGWLDEAGNAGWWPAPQPAPSVVDGYPRCPYAGGC